MEVKVSKGLVIRDCHWVTQSGLKSGGEGVGGELGGRGLCGTETCSSVGDLGRSGCLSL